MLLRKPPKRETGKGAQGPFPVEIPTYVSQLLRSRRIHILVHTRLSVVVELIVDLLRGLCRELRHHEDARERDDEGRQKLVDAEHAAERLDEVVPNHYRDSSAEHARKGAGNSRRRR